jgi:hypothetical protein
MSDQNWDAALNGLMVGWIITGINAAVTLWRN